MSEKSAQNLAPKIIIDDSFYEILANRRAARNAELAAQGLPPLENDSSFMSESQARAEAEARAKQRATQAAPPVLPRPGWAVRSILKTRRESIDGFERHSRKCYLCRHPHLEEIENAYLNWHSAYDICRLFQVADPDMLYRHARAARLDAARRGNVRYVVEHFIEQAHNVKITSSTVLRSIRALSCLDDKGRWADLPKTHIVVRGGDQDASATGFAEAGSHGPSHTGFPENQTSLAEFSSSKQRQPHRVSASNSALPENDAARSFTSTERSEPQHRHINPSASKDHGQDSGSSLSSSAAKPGFSEPAKNKSGPDSETPSHGGRVLLRTDH